MPLESNLPSRMALTERAVTGLHESLMPHLEGINRQAPVLDIGCGTGAWIERLAAEGFSHLHGIDLDVAQFAAHAGTCSQANLDHDTVGLPGDSYGFISAIELIEHLENPGRLFFHVDKLLAPDGCMLITTPNIESILCRLRFLLTGNLKQFDAKGDPTHIYPVLSVCLDRILIRYGLEIFKTWGFPHHGRSNSSRAGTELLARLISPLLPERIGGDIQCFLIRRT